MTAKLYHYKDSGLDYVYLASGVTRRQTSYGVGYAIADLDDLHRMIAKHVVTSSRKICGQEVRFLRSVMELSQTSLAKIMGVNRSTVARWEGQPHAPISDIADSAIRLVYAGHQDAASVIKDVVAALQAEDEKADGGRKVTLRFRNGWRRAA